MGGMSLLSRLYSRRIINVNVNILVAGGLALVALKFFVLFVTEHLGVTDKRAITAITFVADLVLDVGIYYGLHWLANHMPGRLRRGLVPGVPAEYTNLSFFKDASLVQFERATLAPVLYGIALGLQHTLMHAGYRPDRATVIGFAIGILTTRVLHTMWMLRSERRARLRNGARTASNNGLAPGTPTQTPRGLPHPAAPPSFTPAAVGQPQPAQYTESGK